MITGVGPGSANKLREQYGYTKVAAAHTEYTRMLAEHGLLGLLSMILLFYIVYNKLFLHHNYISQHYLLSFSVLTLLTMSHSAMRLSMVGVVFGLMFPKYDE